LSCWNAVRVLLPLATGRRDWSQGIDEGTVVSGDPALAKGIPALVQGANDGVPAE
jgi:hypothetical protein